MLLLSTVSEHVFIKIPENTGLYRILGVGLGFFLTAKTICQK
jgi:hypothetical protein